MDAVGVKTISFGEHHAAIGRDRAVPLVFDVPDLLRAAEGERHTAIAVHVEAEPVDRELRATLDRPRADGELHRQDVADGLAGRGVWIVEID